MELAACDNVCCEDADAAQQGGLDPLYLTIINVVIWYPPRCHIINRPKRKRAPSESLCKLSANSYNKRGLEASQVQRACY